MGQHSSSNSGFRISTMLSLVRKSNNASAAKQNVVKRFFRMVKTPGDVLIAPNGDRVPYPVGIKEPIKFPIHSVGAKSLKVYLPEGVHGAVLINKAQELYTNVFRPHLMLLTPGSWVVCGSNAELIVTRTQQEAEEFAYRYFQPADGSVDCFVTCVGSEFTELVCLGDLVINHKDGLRNAIDKTASQILTIQPLPGEEGHSL